MTTRLALLWHMHQPAYVSPVDGETVLPWVRLHATHAYYDMARVLESHPRVRVTVNFVPSLVEQLEAAARGTSRERYLRLSATPAESLSPADRRLVVERFFMTSHARSVLPVARYAELLRRREQQGWESFGAGELRDLQLHFNLSWMGHWARQDEPEVARLVAKGRDYTADDQRALLAVQQRLVARVLPLWRKLAQRGQVELTTTPYYHPILPLLIDTEAAHRALPQATLPPRLQLPEDAREQVRRALALHERVFGRRPRGMWPAEGSVSPEAAQLLAEEGVQWVASDEGVLARSEPAPKVGAAHLRPWRMEPSATVTRGARPLTLLFRDRALSDRIGFVYARMPAAEAVDDLLRGVKAADASARAAGVEQPVVPVVLDGENAWEHYEAHGGPFLEALHRALETDREIETLTGTQAATLPAGRLQRLHSGSWIEASYRIWIGHPEDNLAWELLGRVRALWTAHAARGDVAPEPLERARTLLLAAQGSDWFWWYGDDFETDNAAEFDQLFRDHLRVACTLLGETPPARLGEPLSAQARGVRRGAPPSVTLPIARISPRLERPALAYGDWLGSGTLLPESGRGAMFEADGAIKRVDFGNDDQRLYLRVVAARPLRSQAMHVALGGPDESAPLQELIVTLDEAGQARCEAAGVRLRCRGTLELAVPLASVGLAGAPSLRLQLRLVADGQEQERLPRGAPLAFERTNAATEARHWVG